MSKLRKEVQQGEYDAVYSLEGLDYKLYLQKSKKNLSFCVPTYHSPDLSSFIALLELVSKDLGVESFEYNRKFEKGEGFFLKGMFCLKFFKNWGPEGHYQVPSMGLKPEELFGYMEFLKECITPQQCDL